MQASNHRKVLSLRAIVVSVAGKVGTISRLVRSGEASESKPSMTVRKGSDDVETGGGPISRDKLGGGLMTARAASGCARMVGARSLHKSSALRTLALYVCQGLNNGSRVSREVHARLSAWG